MLLDKQETRINLLIIIIFNFLLFLFLLFNLDDYLFCSMFFLYLSSLLFIKLFVICWNAVPRFSQFLCNIANGYAGIFSFDLEEQEKNWRQPLVCIGILELLFCFSFRRNVGFYFSVIKALSTFTMPSKFYFSTDMVFHLSEHFLENSEKVTVYLCSFWQVCPKNAYDGALWSLRAFFPMLSYFSSMENSHSLVAQLMKMHPPAMRETWVSSLGWEDPLEKGKATHSSILAWRIP